MSHGLLALLLLAALAGPVAATSIGDLGCVRNTPCPITSSFLVTDLSTLDFGTGAVTLTRSGQLDVVGGTMTIIAGSLTLEPSSRLFARGDVGRAGDKGGSIFVRTTGDVRIQASGTGRARIDVSAAQQGGSFSLDAGGNVEVNGIIAAQAALTTGDGGAVDLSTPGSVTIGAEGEINAFGGTESFGGDVTIFAGGGVAASGPIACYGGDGGTIIISSGSTLTTDAGATMDARSNQPFGDGGSIAFDAGGDLNVGGKISVQGEGTSVDGGSAGGDITLISKGTVNVAAELKLFGASPDGEGGVVEITADRNIIQTGVMGMPGKGGEGTGGSASLTAGGDITLGSIDVGGGAFGGGDVTVMAGNKLTVPAEINADASGGVGGSVGFTAQTLEMNGNVHASGTSSGNGGTFGAQACTLNVRGTANTRPAPGVNTLQASGQMTLFAGSSLLAGSANRLEYRLLRPMTFGMIDPATQPVPNPDLPLCAGERPPDCGNNHLDAGEECDDGNTTACDGCSPDCHVEPGLVCGDVVKNLACGEECDDGNTNSCDGCSSTCHPDRVCGNGVPECGEQCDDGNTTSCDHCSALCRPDNLCGDAVIECGEECDEGAGNNGQPGHTCDAGCKLRALPTCGDGHLDAGEECDFGTNGCNGCSPTCLIEICRNNIIDCREQCDDGNFADCDGCSSDCQDEKCGNGVVDCDEFCDDGNAVNGDACDDNCKPPACGNGVQVPPEQCDDGNLIPGDGCDATCRIETPCPDGQPGSCTPCEVDRDCDPAGQCAGQKCVAHVCATVTPLSCDDGRRDTRDRCVLDAGGAPRCEHDCLAASACVDADPCTDDTCAAATGCVNTPRTGFPAADCRVDTIDRAIGQAGPADLAVAFGRRIGKVSAKAAAKLAAAEAAAQAGNTKRERKLLRAAKTRFAKIEQLVGTGYARNKISQALFDVLAPSANGATGAVVVILDGLTTPGH